MKARAYVQDGVPTVQFLDPIVLDNDTFFELTTTLNMGDGTYRIESGVVVTADGAEPIEEVDP